jgi:lipoyl-dependent peroxiredoxin
MAVRRSEATWEGNLIEGKGRMRLGSGAYEGPFSFQSRFESGSGTNPEELIGAAHAGCFSMALSAGLAKAGYTAKRIQTTAEVHLEKVGEGFKITRIHLTTDAEVPNLDQKTFREQAEKTKQTCPVSAALAGVEISLEARLKGEAARAA